MRTRLPVLRTRLPALTTHLRVLRTRLPVLTRRLRRAGDADEGSAVVEFLGVTLVLLVPVVYLVLVLAQLQAAAFAVDGAAREAGRAFVTADDDARARAVAAVGLALEDQGLDPADAAEALTLVCSESDCRAPGSTVTAEVAVDVTLVGVPAFVSDVVPLVVPVSAVATIPVERFVAGNGT